MGGATATAAETPALHSAPSVPQLPDAAASTGESRRTTALVLTCVSAVNLVLLWTFHNRGWLPADDGHYVHVADRLAAGQTLNADVEELHPGYVHFIHGWSLQLFGERLVSIRYPLMALLFGQSIVTFGLLRRAGLMAAATAAVAMTGIGALQMSTPTTSQYALATTVVLVAWMAMTTPTTTRRFEVIGVLLGMVFLFRQLTAVFVVMGALSFLVLEDRDPLTTNDRNPTAGRILLGLSALGLAGYLGASTSVSGALLFGVFPLLLLTMNMHRVTMASSEVASMVVRVGAGAFISAVPLLGYHLLHGSTVVWLNDTFLRSLSVNGLEHISINRYWNTLVMNGLVNLLDGTTGERLNGLWWIALVGAASAVGLMLWRRLRTLRPGGLPTRFVVPWIAVFSALVSVFNQIPYYLYLSAGFSLVAVVWTRALTRRPGPSTPVADLHERGLQQNLVGHRPVPLLCAGLLALTVIGVASHAGQTYTRSSDDWVGGHRMALVESTLPRLGLWIDPAEEQSFTEVLAVIERSTAPGEAIFTIPNNAELYFLSDRPNPFRIFNPTLSLINDAERKAFAAEFAEAKPALIVFDTESPYTVGWTWQFMNELTDGYRLSTTIGEYEVWERRESG